MKIKETLDLEVVLMAGGKGTRLLPLTKDTPKPMLLIGDKPILEHNIDHLRSFGVNHFHIAVNYLGHQIEHYFRDGSHKKIDISYLKETRPLGTIGALSLESSFYHDHILVMNSDILTTIDFKKMYAYYIEKDCDLLMATVPFKVDVPYSIVETKQHKVSQIIEEPSFSYNVNAGMYIFKKECLKHIPQNTFFHTTDFIKELLNQDKDVQDYPFNAYWLDIGKPEDYKKANEAIKTLNFRQINTLP
ncbi:sugar phosphate nucleotidyltransferase [Sediminibacter sp. Hel_I_10]|uniref:nucleotidyltransferase family protein n=1 Tax=Sediminibacter sp. Hel_I_10 TaxID=1392490 RepID=UPI0018CC0A1C|nr:sugar phosphate nucleotidyltransferase [Sediminibacter sp. Hel_I_10]